LAIAVCAAITLLFLDFTGCLHHYWGWLAKVQLLPAILAGNFIIVAVLAVLTLICGRIYCSVICPLGIMQDVFARLGRLKKKNRYNYSPAKNILRYIFLAIFIIALVTGIGSVVALLAPYSSFGRIVENLLSPFWIWGNNLLAYWAEKTESYAFYSVDVWLKSGLTLIVSILTVSVIGWLAWRNGRTYCNSVCPVGTILGFLSRFSLLKPVIDTSKCNSCGLCARNCKAACIDSKQHSIDYSRCVVCLNCISICKKGAITYQRRKSDAVDQIKNKDEQNIDKGRRSMLAGTASLATVSLLHAQEKTTDGGLAIIIDKKIPKRNQAIRPAGAQGEKHFTSHCTACQLCVSACPNGVLRPSKNLETLMQPEMSFERGYCRPECTRCSEVCPAGAIRLVDKAEKSAIQIGHAVWIKQNCIAANEKDICDNCARHCPTGAIQMIEQNGKPAAPKIPAINTERCIGCGACENLCPARPFSAIYVEGHDRHKTL